MKRIFSTGSLRTLKIALATAGIAFMTLTVQAQEQKEHANQDVRLGQKALLDGDFKAATEHLNKALPAVATDANVIYLLGYSQFQTGDFATARTTFEKVVKLDAKHSSALYYKGKSAHNLATSGKKLSHAATEKLLLSAVVDYSSAIAITANDPKLYTNRGIAYRDLGILNGTSGTPNYAKVKATDFYNKALTDLEKVLTYDASRKDIQTEVKKAKVYRDNLK